MSPNKPTMKVVYDVHNDVLSPPYNKTWEDYTEECIITILTRRYEYAICLIKLQPFF